MTNGSEALILNAIADLKSVIQGLDNRIADLEGKINAFPDLHFLQAAAQQQLSDAREANRADRLRQPRRPECRRSAAG